MQLTQSLFADEYDDLTDLADTERATARNWHEDFREKYDIVGRLLKPGETPSVYSAEDSELNGTTTATDELKKNE
ncbi:unnamed protein product [Rotaria magnacalcarata]|nr:unnamed protein product [Rotaria magnacalcarata]